MHDRSCLEGSAYCLHSNLRLAVDCYYDDEAILEVGRALLKKNGVGGLIGEVRLKWRMEIPRLH